MSLPFRPHEPRVKPAFGARARIGDADLTTTDAVLRGTQNSPLPPSVETAYYRKCIELKRRINEIEESNDAARLRKIRIDRQILKMRLERAFLLEQLQKRMEHNVDESDRSTSPPPTPQDKPLRSKRAHRKTTPPPQPGMSTLTPGSSVTQPPASHPPNSQSQTEQQSYFDSSAPGIPQPAGLPPLQPSTSTSVPPGSFHPIQPASGPFPPSSTRTSLSGQESGRYSNGAQPATESHPTGGEKYDGADEREDGTEDRKVSDTREASRDVGPNGSTDRPVDGEEAGEAAAAGFTALNR